MPTPASMASRPSTLSFYSLSLIHFCTKGTLALRPSFETRASMSTSSSSMAIAAAEKIIPAVIVGGGRLGKALQDMGGGYDVLVRRGEPVPPDFAGPIFVCTRNDDLDAVLGSTPKSRWSDLVFFQNGMLEPWFESKQIGEADQVLAYFAVSKLGEPPIDGVTDTNPEGLTSAYGKWASAIAGRLRAGGLSCKVLEKDAFQKHMLEKLIWICAFMLVGGRHRAASVGVVEKEYRSEVSALIAELASAAAAEKSVVFEGGIEDRLCAYSRAVAHFPTAVKEREYVFASRCYTLTSYHLKSIFVHSKDDQPYMFFYIAFDDYSSNGGMDGFIRCPRRRLRRADEIRVHCTRHGLKN